jgi:hypothetical protein
MSNGFVNTDKISEYLELSKDSILLTGAKILAALESKDDASELLSLLTTLDIKLDYATELYFVSECLTQCDKILATTMIELNSPANFTNLLSKFIGRLVQ